MQSRVFSLAASLGLALLTLGAAPPAPKMTVYKTRTCGCCAKWVDHMKANGFATEVIEVQNTAEARKQLGIPANMASCHSAKAGNLVIEGHVPAEDVKRLMADKSTRMKGIAVPGMPVGSPGMEMGTRRDAYNVMVFDAQDRPVIYRKYTFVP